MVMKASTVGAAAQKRMQGSGAADTSRELCQIKVLPQSGL